ncbi:hypothetical protein EG832_07755 [bacterium]|nr:hypothetical protein [bacterium]
MSKTVIDYLEREDLTYPWNLIAEDVGMDAIRKLFRRLPSTALYVPNMKKNKKLLKRYVRDNCPDIPAQQLAWDMEISLPFAYDILKHEKHLPPKDQRRLFGEGDSL